MEYNNIIEELMDTKVKELLSKPFGLVLDINHTIRHSVDNISRAASFLEKRIWQEILLDTRVENLHLIEKWNDMLSGNQFLVLQIEDGNMYGIMICEDGLIDYCCLSDTIKERQRWEMSRLKGDKLGNYFSSFNEIYFEDLMPYEY